MGLFLIGLLLSKKKGNKHLQAVNEGSNPLEVVYEDPDTAASGSLQPSISQSKEVRTADNVAYSTELQDLQDKRVKTQDNLAYSVVSTVS